MDLLEHAIQSYLDKAILKWQQDRQLIANQFGQEVRQWLKEILKNLPNADWRASWEAFVADWHGRGLTVKDSSQLVEFLERRELAAREGRASDVPQMPELFAAPDPFPQSLSGADAPSRHVQFVAMPSGGAKVPQKREYKPEEFHPERVLPPGSKFTAEDVVLALQVAHAINTMEERTWELVLEINKSHSLIADINPTAWQLQVAKYQREVEVLHREVDQLKKEFSRAGLDEIELWGHFGASFQPYGGKGLAGAREILSGLRFNRVGLESTFVEDVGWATLIAGLTRAVAARTAKAAFAAVGSRLLPKLEKAVLPRIIRLGKNRIRFDGLEVRAVRDLSHIDEVTLREMAKKGFAANDTNGQKLILHHLRQDPAGPIVEMPAVGHTINNPVQHPLGNVPGVGLTAEQRAAFNAWRVEYWKARATEELTRRGSAP